MNEKLTVSSVSESPESFLEDKDKIRKLQNELLSYVGLNYLGVSKIDLAKAKELIENNPELSDELQTSQFKKKIGSLVYETPEFVSRIKEIFSYTDKDIEDVLFEGITFSRYEIEENLRSAVKKFGLPQSFEDRVNDESIIRALVEESTYIFLHLDYYIKKLTDIEDMGRVEGIIKEAIRRASQSDSCVCTGGWFMNMRNHLMPIFDVDSFVKSPEMKAVSIERVRTHLIDGDLSLIEEWMKFSDLSVDDIRGLDESKHYIDTLFYAELPSDFGKGDDPFWGFRSTRRNFFHLEKVKSLFGLPDEIYDTDVFQEQIKNHLLNLDNLESFVNLGGDGIQSNLKRYRIKAEVLSSSEFKTKLITESCRLIQYEGNFGLEQAQKMLDNLGVLKLSDPEFKKPLLNTIVKLFQQQGGDMSKVVKLLHLSEISENDKKELAVKLYIQDLKSSSRGSRLKTIQEVFEVKLDIDSTEYISASQEDLIESLKTGDLLGIGGLIISREFLARSEIRESAERAISICIEKSHWKETKELKELFGFDDEIIIAIALRHLNQEQAILDEVIETEEGDEGEEDEDISDFILSLQSIAPTLSSEHIRLANPEIQRYLEDLRDRFPFINTERSVSLEFTIFLMETVKTPSEVFAALEKAPFLASAMESNPHLSIKLLRQYPKLDDLSQDNISFLYNIKSEIRSKGISGRPLFAEMNQRLAGYRNNEKVIESYKEEGVDMNSWLNFPKETEFNLVGGDESVSALALSGNFERLAKSYKKYLENAKSKIEEYKEELMNRRLPSIDQNEFDEQISKMNLTLEKTRLLPESWRDKNGKSRDKVIFGIEKGIENLKRQKENDKGVPMWLKVTSEFSKIEQKLSNLSVAFNDLKREETVLRRIGELSGEKKGFPVFDIAFMDLEKKGKLPESLKNSGTKNVQSNLDENPHERFFTQKIKVRELKKASQDLWGQFIKGFDSLNEWLARDLSESIGSERYSAILQEVKQDLGLEGDHMESDTRTIKSFFNEHKEGVLDGRSMRISLWERDPDVDLYLGNYTDCCIRIDSEYHGSECVISDYLTDLGIQVAVVYDEKEKKPVLAAWLWVGKEKTTGEVSLVIDNIEANTDYTSQYSEVLGNNLREYMKSYAEEIGVGSVVQGPKNNDLVVADIIENKSYKKIGGYNRPDGYYLEAEIDEI